MESGIKRMISWILVLAGVNLLFGCGFARAASDANEGGVVRLPYTFMTGPMKKKRDIALEYKGKFAKVPVEVMVYKAVEPNVTEAYVRQLGEKHFGMSADANFTRSSGRFFWLRDKNWFLDVDGLDGSFWLRKSTSLEESNKKVRELRRLENEHKLEYPCVEECKVIAEGFLREHDVLTSDACVRGVADNTHGAHVMSVGFHKKINGYSGYGAGFKIVVYVGPGGRVDGIYKAWPELIPWKMYPVKGPEEALAELRNHKGILFNGSKGMVEEISLGYYRAAKKRGGYIQPVYYFSCRGAKRKFYGCVGAIKNEYVKSKAEMEKGLQKKKSSVKRGTKVQ